MDYFAEDDIEHIKEEVKWLEKNQHLLSPYGRKRLAVGREYIKRQERK